MNGFVDENKLLVEKLIRVDNLLVYNYESNLMEVFVNSIRNKLKILNIGIDGLRNDENQQNLIFKQISKLENLEELKLWLCFGEEIDFSKLAQSLKNISHKCLKLKSLDLKIKNMTSINVQKFMETFGSFVNLKYFKFKPRISNNINICSLINCNKLTHLSLDELNMNDNYFENIDLYFPQLEYLFINTEDIITDKSLYSLAKLKNLKVISFDWTRPQLSVPITDKGLIHFINNCQNIESIRFNKKPKISYKTIDALIELALNKPRIKFNHKFRRRYTENGIQIIHGLIVGTTKPLPNNLNIEFSKFWDISGLCHKYRLNDL